MASELPDWFVKTLASITFSISGVGILTGLYGNFRLYRTIDEQFMTPRCFSLQMFTNFSLLLSIVATCAALQAQLSSNNVSFMTYSNPDSANETRGSDIFLMCLGDVLLMTCYNLFICCILTTSWLIFYREKWQFYSLQEQWQCIIRREAASANWFVVHNRYLGNKSFVARAVGAYHFLSAITSAVGIVCYHLDKISLILSAVMAATPILISVAFYVWINMQTLQMRLVDDIWFVHWERVTIGKLLSLFIFMYTLQQIVLNILDISSLLCSLIFSPMFATVTYAIHYVSTFGILFKNSSAAETAKRIDLGHTVVQIGTVEMKPIKSAVAMIDRGHWTSHPAEGTSTGAIASTIRSKCSFPPKRTTSMQQTQRDAKYIKKRRPASSKCTLTGSPARCELGGSGSARGPQPHQDLDDNVDSIGDADGDANSANSNGDDRNTLSAVPHPNQESEMEMEMEVELQGSCEKSKNARAKKRGNSPTTRRPITFSRLLAKDDLLHLFMLHLSREFNMECLLAYIEMTQYQTLALSQLDLQIDEDLYHLVPFSNNLPISSIVEYSITEHLPSLVKMGIEFNCHDLEHDLKMKARRLFMKYMSPGCEYECNISGRLRARAIRMLRNQCDLFLDEDITVKKIFLLFEDVKNELARFLHPSFYAFKHTKDWIIVRNLLNLD